MSRSREIRAYGGGIALRAAEDGGESSSPTLFGHFAVFDRWTEINSWFEGHFMERIAPGAFRKTFRENRDRIRALFQHGQDPQVGDKPIGRIDELREDDVGGYYEVGLYDGLPTLVMEGLADGQYGASFRFEVMREELVESPEPSEDNPRGIAERTLKELRLFEFGPVTFPAYQEATADVRSLTDWFLFEQIARNPERARELASLRSVDFGTPDPENPAPAPPDADDVTSGPVARREATADYLSREADDAWRL